VLLDTIDLADYWLVILGPLQAKWPSGIPWTLMCGEDGCNQQEDVKLNIARCIRFGSGLFSDLQKQLWARQRGTERPVISIAEQREYIAAHQVDPSSVFEYHDVRVEFGRSTLGSFFDSTEKWIEDVNASTTAALSEFATERERESHMRLTAEARRLTRYAHMVKSITVNEQREVNGEMQVIPQTETDTAKIVEMLEELSSDRIYVGQFENAIAEYNERTRLAVFGYMGKRCPACGKTHGEKDGLYRGIVTISPDRVFFVLSRVVSEIQKFLLDQYADIG
jgi:DNA-directed RNA polymerase subunit F